MDKRTLVARDGKMYVLSEDTLYNEPVITKAYYPLDYENAFHFTRDFGEHKLGQRLTYNRLFGYYTDEDGLKYALKNGKNTMPDIFEQEPYPCPNVRKGIETRYCGGRWQKLLKEGWITHNPTYKPKKGA